MTVDPRASTFDHFDPLVMQDPYPIFASVRAACPLGQSEAHGGFYYPTTFEGVKQVFADFRTFTSTQGTALPVNPVSMLPIDLDPPHHTHFRKLLNPFFTVEAAERDRGRVEGVVAPLISAFEKRGSAELARELTRPTLSGTMLPIIGVPEDDRVALNAALEYMAHYRTSDPQGWAERSQFVMGYLMQLSAKRREEPARADLLQALIDQPVAGAKLTDEEIFRVLLVTLFGALDTTHSALTEALLHLGRHPQDRRRLRSGEVAWPEAIEEFLRFSSPIQVLRRTTSRAVTIDGGQIPAGAPVLALNGAANRDPARFESPDRCLLDRGAIEHMAFGSGAHICLGRNYARVMIDVVLKAMLERIPDFDIEPGFEPEYSAGEARGLKRLPITFPVARA